MFTLWLSIETLQFTGGHVRSAAFQAGSWLRLQAPIFFAHQLKKGLKGKYRSVLIATPLDFSAFSFFFIFFLLTVEPKVFCLVQSSERKLSLTSSDHKVNSNSVV